MRCGCRRRVHRPQLASAASAAAPPAAAAAAARRSTVHFRPLAVWMVAPVAMPTCGVGGRGWSIMACHGWVRPGRMAAGTAAGTHAG